MSWNRMKRMIEEMKRREAKARSIAARDREMPKMKKILAK